MSKKRKKLKLIDVVKMLSCTTNSIVCIEEFCANCYMTDMCYELNQLMDAYKIPAPREKRPFSKDVQTMCAMHAEPCTMVFHD